MARQLYLLLQIGPHALLSVLTRWTISAPNNFSLNPRGILPLPTSIHPSLSYLEALKLIPCSYYLLPPFVDKWAIMKKVNISVESKKTLDGNLSVSFLQDLETLNVCKLLYLILLLSSS
ncbi:hypothetical protein O6H91_06G055500 [Diphasiastrum complanatum]|uniref:Uncharacterized protein n=1 Tax=Diphasiastrum complanatum TaxID=34168 RepID=A0ACC2DDR2_DIPCM|nr:hypothetical protein O6H91_06G055500 [Diphasiastrum complanatum]